MHRSVGAFANCLETSVELVDGRLRHDVADDGLSRQQMRARQRRLGQPSTQFWSAWKTFSEEDEARREKEEDETWPSPVLARAFTL